MGLHRDRLTLLAIASTSLYLSCSTTTIVRKPPNAVVQDRLLISSASAEPASGCLRADYSCPETETSWISRRQMRGRICVALQQSGNAETLADDARLPLEIPRQKERFLQELKASINGCTHHSEGPNLRQSRAAYYDIDVTPSTFGDQPSFREVLNYSVDTQKSVVQ